LHWVRRSERDPELGLSATFFRAAQPLRPVKRAGPKGVARFVAVTALTGAVANTQLGQNAQHVGSRLGLGQQNAAPLRPGWCSRQNNICHLSFPFLPQQACLYRLSRLQILVHEQGRRHHPSTLGVDPLPR
jgi:hypothetical protein